MADSALTPTPETSARHVPGLLTLAGIAGPVCFTTLVILQGFLLPDYSHVRDAISALAAWPTGWLQELNFYVFGALTIAFAYVLHHAVRPTRAGSSGIALLVLSGLGLIMSGLFSWRMVDGVPRETIPHVVAAVIVFLGTGAGLITLSRGLRADAQWRDLANYTLVSGITVTLLFGVAGAFAMREGTPLHPWAGALQRVVCGVWFACEIALAGRARAVARS